ncbi:MAG TPA: ParB/RepB/Spo0J family partition protein [Pyrinomonadaceae bacterium]|jgi:ParB/RepB/Spo0J family partition protein
MKAVKQTPVIGKIPKIIPKPEKALRVSSPDNVVAIETSQIIPSSFEPQARRRARFKTEDLINLGESIKKHRLRQPILVRPVPGGKYEIVFGERRWAACRIVGIEKINCFVEDLSDAEVLELQYEENHRRLEPNPLGDAFYFQFLIETQGYTSNRIAMQFNLDADEVRRLLKLNDLIAEGKEELSAGILPLPHAVYLASFPPESQKEITAKQYAYRYHDREEKAVSFAAFKEEIAVNIIRLLESAPFDTYDPQLHWNGLICADCNERTGFPGQLFPDLAKDDSCLNKSCFDWKTGLYLKRQRERIAASMPNPESKPVEMLIEEVPLVTSKSWTDEKTPFAGKVLTDQKLLTRPECEHSKLSLVVEGERKGKQAYICENKTCPVHKPAAYAEANELKKKQAEFERNVAALAREKVFASAVEAFNGYVPFWHYADLVQKLLLTLWQSCGVDTRKPILRIIKGWRNLPEEGNEQQLKDFLASLDHLQQDRLLFLLVHRTTGFYANDNQTEVKKIATDYARRDYARFDAEARFELAPEEFKQSAAEYLAKVASGIDAEIPAFWWGFDEEAADAAVLEVE